MDADTRTLYEMAIIMGGAVLGVVVAIIAGNLSASWAKFYLERKRLQLKQEDRLFTLELSKLERQYDTDSRRR